MDFNPVRRVAELGDCRNRFGLDGRCCPHPVRRRPRFLHAKLDGQNTPKVCHSSCRVDRTVCRLGSAGGYKFRGRHPRAGDISAVTVARCCPAASAVSLYVRSPGEIWMESGSSGPYGRRTLLVSGGRWFVTKVLGITLVFFSAKQNNVM